MHLTLNSILFKINCFYCDHDNIAGTAVSILLAACWLSTFDYCVQTLGALPLYASLGGLTVIWGSIMLSSLGQAPIGGRR